MNGLRRCSLPMHSHRPEGGQARSHPALRRTRRSPVSPHVPAGCRVTAAGAPPLPENRSKTTLPPPDAFAAVSCAVPPITFRHCRGPGKYHYRRIVLLGIKGGHGPLRVRLGGSPPHRCDAPSILAVGGRRRRREQGSREAVAASSNSAEAGSTERSKTARRRDFCRLGALASRLLARRQRQAHRPRRQGSRSSVNCRAKNARDAHLPTVSPLASEYM